MKLSFFKMHGAGNDFILADDRDEKFPVDDTELIERVASRRTGIGSDGLILIQPSDRADFRMRFFNPDGNEAEMCGNGARCVASLANRLDIAPATMSIDTQSGILNAEIRDGLVLLHMTPPVDWRMDRVLDLPDRSLSYCFVNTGVPHAVVLTEDLDGVDIQSAGASIRYHADFAPAGTNANFIAVTGRDALRIRTYERGVEAETLACGTGIVAAALIAGRLGHVEPPVNVTCASGDVLVVGYNLADDDASEVTLLGPAVNVFEGTVEI